MVASGRNASSIRSSPSLRSGHLTADMRFAYAHPNPYGFRIPAER